MQESQWVFCSVATECSCYILTHFLEYLSFDFHAWEMIPSQASHWIMFCHRTQCIVIESREGLMFFLYCVCFIIQGISVGGNWPYSELELKHFMYDSMLRRVQWHFCDFVVLFTLLIILAGSVAQIDCMQETLNSFLCEGLTFETLRFDFTLIK